MLNFKVNMNKIAVVYPMNEIGMCIRDVPAMTYPNYSCLTSGIYYVISEQVGQMYLVMNDTGKHVFVDKTWFNILDY